MKLIAPRPEGNGERKTGLTIVIDSSQRNFLEAYRAQQGLRSAAHAARELLYLGALAVADT